MATGLNERRIVCRKFAVGSVTESEFNRVPINSKKHEEKFKEKFKGDLDEHAKSTQQDEPRCCIIIVATGAQAQDANPNAQANQEAADKNGRTRHGRDHRFTGSENPK